MQMLRQSRKNGSDQLFGLRLQRSPGLRIQAWVETIVGPWQVKSTPLDEVPPHRNQASANGHCNPRPT